MSCLLLPGWLGSCDWNKAQTATQPTVSASAAPSSSASAGAAPAGSEGDAGAHHYLVPFAWEASHQEPLAQTRGYLRKVFTDNSAFMQAHPATFFKPFLNEQKPRATVVLCSDSRVQSAAFDATPENDSFVVRNIGNQFATAAGSIDYGVHHLKTPLLLIVGHTACGAIKAAMGDYTKESPEIRHELESISVPKTKAETIDPHTWLEGVNTNVNNQVAAALSHYQHELEEGALTVVGAVYDFRDDMKQGFGRLMIINVNGNTEASKIESFVRAIQQPGAPIPSASAPLPPNHARH